MFKKDTMEGTRWAMLFPNYLFWSACLKNITLCKAQSFGTYHFAIDFLAIF